jgi:hypothetical protein
MSYMFFVIQCVESFFCLSIQTIKMGEARKKGGFEREVKLKSGVKNGKDCIELFPSPALPLNTISIFQIWSNYV